MKHIISVICCLLSVLCCSAAGYYGRVVDAKGSPIAFATVYPEDKPAMGTATNDRGVFFITSEGLTKGSNIIISFVGYRSASIALGNLHTTDTVRIVLHEQPIALDEATVSAKHKRLRGKNRDMQQLLYKVYNQLNRELSANPTRYAVVSDMRMQSEQQNWGAEQLVATIVTLPEAAKSGRDSVQLHGEVCKRFFRPEIRQRADQIYTGTEMSDKTRKMAAAVDSGVVIHRELFAMGDVRYNMEKTIKDIRHWEQISESQNELILRHTEGKNYLGIFKWTHVRNYVVHPKTYALIRTSEQVDMAVSIPFGHKLKGEELQMLNLLNMSEQQIDKFRLRHGTISATLTTRYKRTDGKLTIQEKNLKSDATLTSTKGHSIPVHYRATQRVTKTETSGVKAMSKKQITRRMPRRIVEVY